MKNDLAVVAEFEGDFVAERDRLQQRHDLVITILSLTENLQGPVYFGEGRKPERSVVQRVMKVWVR